MLSFKPAFSLSSINRLFSSSPLSAIKMVLSAYLSLLIFTSAILIPACASSSLAFHMMYSAYKLNKQGDLHIGYTGGRYDSLVFPSLEEFSTVCGDPHSQSLCLKGVKPPLQFGERTPDCSPGHAGKEGPQLATTGVSQEFPRAAAPVGVF